MATMRDVENLIFPEEEGSPSYVGITTPWEMKGWAYEILECNYTEFISTVFYGEFEAMREAQRAIDAGGVAFPLINSRLVGNPEPVVYYPDHWISLLGDLRMDEGVWSTRGSGNISFDCYTWGERKHIDVGEETSKTACGES